MNHDGQPKLNPFVILNSHSTTHCKDGKERVFAFAPEPSDVILCSYPKADTKRIEIILWKFLRPQMDLPPIDTDTNRFIPCCEIVGPQRASTPSWKKPRLIKTHFHSNCIPSNPKAKYIYVFRNPWDTIVKCHESMKKSVPSYDESFDQFLDRFLEGHVGYGSYFNHVSAWYERRKEENVLVLCHELIKTETRSTLFSIAGFLGERFLKNLLNSEQEVREILKLVDSFTKSKDNGLYIKSLLNDPVFTTAQTVAIGNSIEQKLKKTGVDHLWARIFKTTNSRILQKDELTNVISKTEWQLTQNA